MNELDRKRMMTIAKMVRNTANTEGWTEDDETRQLATLAIFAFEEISRLRHDIVALRQGCREARIVLDDVLTRIGTMDRFPIIVCLCGSTRFWRTFRQAGLQETLAGRIVLSIGAASGTDEDHFGNLSRGEYDRVKAMLDELHLRKIDLADEVLILNVGGYIGESTRRELDYARVKGKVIRWWESIDGVERKES